MRFLCEINTGETQAEHTERESELLRKGGERDRTETMREYGMGFYQGWLFLVLTDSPKSA